MNLPNILSLFRLVLVPAFPIVFFSPIPGARYWAAGIYILAFLTDVADGRLARKFDQVTKLGRVLDPLADKLMALTVIISITVAGIIPWWAVAGFLLKEALMGVGAIVMYRKTHDIMPANYLGKAATGTFFAVCALLVLIPAIPPVMATWMVGVALGLAILAFVVYLVQFFTFNRAHAITNEPENIEKS